jgi:hypothetical protein
VETVLLDLVAPVSAFRELGNALAFHWRDESGGFAFRSTRRTIPCHMNAKLREHGVALEWDSSLPTLSFRPQQITAKSGDLRSGGTLRFSLSRGWPIQARFWLEWDCPHSPTLSFRPQQITAGAVICGVEEPAV